MKTLHSRPTTAQAKARALPHCPAPVSVVMRSIPKKASDMREKIRQLEREVAGLAVTGMLDELMERYADLPGVVSHLERMREDIVENVGLFLPSAENAPGPPQQAGADDAVHRPTRNMTGNTREVRHVNPWNYPVPVHTYEEYEDEFRDVMKASGLPIEKE